MNNGFVCLIGLYIGQRAYFRPTNKYLAALGSRLLLRSALLQPNNVIAAFASHDAFNEVRQRAQGVGFFLVVRMNVINALNATADSVAQSALGGIARNTGARH